MSANLMIPKSMVNDVFLLSKNAFSEYFSYMEIPDETHVLIGMPSNSGELMAWPHLNIEH